MYIAIRLLNKDHDWADYAYGEDESLMGRLRLDLNTGESTVVQPHPEDRTEGMFQRVARKLFLHWKAGEIPESTCWAS